MRLLFIILTLLITNIAYSQTNDYTDTLGNYDFKHKNTSFIGVHGDVGWNKSWFTSLGVSYLSATTSHSHGFAGIVCYVAGEMNLATYNNPTNSFFGYKGGLQYFSNGLYVGVELRGYTDFAGKEHTVFMPNTGLSALGFMNITYGYNVFQDDFNVFGIGHHQIALSVNIARKLFTESFVPDN